MMDGAVSVGKGVSEKQRRVARLCGVALLVAAVLLMGCATSPLGRQQLKWVSQAEVDQAGESTFRQLLRQEPVSRDSAVNAYVLCVAHSVTDALSGPAARIEWQVVVFDSLEPNAFALPSGKIGINRGILRVARTQDQLAAVIGHEVAHVLAEHANERMSAQYATGAAVSMGASAAGAMGPGLGQAAGLLGAGAQMGVLLPYSRVHESEADLLGLDLMARAGFDPAASVTLWENMSRNSGGGPSGFLSTHPSNSQRTQALEERLPHAESIYRRAVSRGHQPHCS